MHSDSVEPQPVAPAPADTGAGEPAGAQPGADSAVWSFASDLGAGYSLHGPEPLVLVLGGTLRGRVTRLSPTAVWATLEGGELPRLAQPLQVHLEASGTTLGPLRGEAFWREEAGGPSVGIQLVGVSVEQGRQLLALLEERVQRGSAEPAASPLPVLEEITNPERIRSILTAACTLKSKARLRQADRAVRLVLEQVDVAGRLLWWRRDEPGSGWGEPPGDIEITGYSSAFRLALQGSVPCGERLLTSLPRRLERMRYRTQRRAPAPPATRARFHHPLWSELGLLDREVFDLSFSGLGVRTRGEDLIFPGLVLQWLEVETAEGDCIRLRAEVRHVSVSGEERVYGLQVSPYAPADEAPWLRFVSQTLGPTTSTSAHLAEPVWELLGQSGYFRQGSSPAQETSLKRSFLSLAPLSAQAPQVLCQAVWPSERGVEGTLSVLKAYQRTWMSHQFALRPQQPEANASPTPQEVLRDLYLRTYEHATGDGECRWMLSYVTRNPWMERAHLAFALQHTRSGEALVRPLQVLSASCEGQDELSSEALSSEALSSEAFDIGPASTAEQALLVRHLGRTRPTCYREALDLVAGRLDLEGVATRWRSAGLERERRLLVARRSGQPVAVAVLELGHRGTNLLQLLDCVRLFVFAPEGRVALSPLLNAARGWYASRGRTSFLYLHEEESWQPPASAGLQPLARLHLWLLSAQLVPEFLEHVSELTAGYSPARQA